MKKLFMKSLFAIVGLAAATSQAACATIFTGTRQKVDLATEPPGATVIVVGGTVGNVLVRAGQASEAVARVVELVAPQMPKDAVEILHKLDVGELITALVLVAKLDQVPSFLPAPAREGIRRVPKPILEKALDFVGVEEVATAPRSVELKKGRPYAIIAWREGYIAGVDGLKAGFNWVVLLNVFNLIIPGTVVDVLTGAWLNLDDKVEIRLREQPRS